MEQPSGLVTFLFTDIEGSTRLLDELGADAYRAALAEHRRVLRDAFARHGGYEVDYEGDAFFVAFQDAAEAVAAAGEAQAVLASGPIRVRMGLHTGTPILDPPKYVGIDVHLAARVMSAGHGGQVLLSKRTRDLVSIDVLDLGEHRLKDFERPVQLYQLGSAGFPPLKTISNTNLPRPASSFVGREREVQELVTHVSASRLVTVTGPGGSGKTRVALEAAADLVGSFRAGVFWIPLATLREAELVLPALAAVIGAADDLAAAIGEREMLILVDNLEQVIDAAPALAGLVEACPNLHLLVTSRERLRVRGEVEYELLPLADTDAVELFLARAATDPSPAVAELCRRVDNMPLALELAAARVKALPVEQILERLSSRLDLFTGGRDADPRQRTLRATIAWSHDLLGPEERDVFARLGVFVGGCTLEAAEAVADADLEALQSLVEKSLLRRTGARYWMLETIAAFAAEQLETMPDAALTRERFAGYLADFGTARAVAVRRSDDAAVAEIAAELDNFRAVLRWADSSGRTKMLLAMVTTLWAFWMTRGLELEGDRWGRRLAASANELAGKERVQAYEFSSELVRMRDPHEGIRLKEIALAESRRLAPEGADTVTLLKDIAQLKALLGDVEEARPLAEEAVELARKSLPESAVGATLSALALVEYFGGNFEKSRDLEIEAYSLYDVDPHASELAIGQCERRLGNLDEARVRLHRALDVSRAKGLVSLYPEVLQEAAAIDVLRGRGEEAAVLFGACERLLEELGQPRWDEPDYERLVDRLRASLPESALAAAWATGAALDTEAALDYAVDRLS